MEAESGSHRVGQIHFCTIAAAELCVTDKQPPQPLQCAVRVLFLPCYPKSSKYRNLAQIAYLCQHASVYALSPMYMSYACLRSEAQLTPSVSSAPQLFAPAQRTVFP